MAPANAEDQPGHREVEETERLLAEPGELAPETSRLVDVPIRVSVGPRIAAKLSGIITAPAERP